MGDRGNIVVKFRDDHEIYLYSHWGGSALPVVLAEALESPEGKARATMKDAPYLARIIFEHMLDKLSTDRETGFGIAPYAPDEEHPHLYVDVETQTVNGWSFEEFIAKVLYGGFNKE